MHDDELLSRIRELREGGSSPKEIARRLGLRPAEVTPLLRRVAAAQASVGPAERPLVGCWINPGWSAGLGLEEVPDWAESDVADDESISVDGFANVFIAREVRAGRANVCCFLVDVYCLGVKDVIGPLEMRTGEIAGYRARVYQAFPLGPVAVPLSVAQHVVHGAVDYARGLGFEPAQEFAGAAPYLGGPIGTTPIRFGRDGRPFYMSGPYDDPHQVMRALNASVGEGNYDFMTHV